MPSSFPHHVLGKGKRPDMKYDVRNGIPLCYECHAIAHDEPNRFNAWFIETYPEDAEYLNLQLKYKGEI